MRVMLCGRPPGSGGNAPHDSRHSILAGMDGNAGAGGGDVGAPATDGAEVAGEPGVDSAPAPPDPPQALTAAPNPAAPANQSVRRRLNDFASRAGVSNAAMVSPYGYRASVD